MERRRTQAPTAAMASCEGLRAKSRPLRALVDKSAGSSVEASIIANILVAYS